MEIDIHGECVSLYSVILKKSSWDSFRAIINIKKEYIGVINFKEYRLNFIDTNIYELIKK